MVGSMLLALLKGTLYLVGETFRSLMVHAGEPSTMAALIEPFLAIPVVYFVARPVSLIPNHAGRASLTVLRRMEEARRRHGEAAPAIDR
jgi:hypothetical protein